MVLGLCIGQYSNSVISCGALQLAIVSVHIPLLGLVQQCSHPATRPAPLSTPPWKLSLGVRMAINQSADSHDSAEPPAEVLHQKWLSLQIWEVQCKLTQGEKFSAEAEAGRFWELTEEQQRLAEDYDSGKISRALNKLLEKQKDPENRAYRGAGVETT